MKNPLTNAVIVGEVEFFMLNSEQILAINTDLEQKLPEDNAAPPSGTKLVS